MLQILKRVYIRTDRKFKRNEKKKIRKYETKQSSKLKNSKYLTLLLLKDNWQFSYECKFKKNIVL